MKYLIFVFTYTAPSIARWQGTYRAASGGRNWQPPACKKVGPILFQCQHFKWRLVNIFCTSPWQNAIVHNEDVQKETRTISSDQSSHSLSVQIPRSDPTLQKFFKSRKSSKDFLSRTSLDFWKLCQYQPYWASRFLIFHSDINPPQCIHTQKTTITHSSPTW